MNSNNPTWHAALTGPPDKIAGPIHDVEIRRHGTVYLFHLHTVAARAWIAENVISPIWFGVALAVEHRYAHDLAAGMLADGLTVE